MTALFFEAVFDDFFLSAGAMLSLEVVYKQLNAIQYVAHTTIDTSLT